MGNDLSTGGVQACDIQGLMRKMRIAQEVRKVIVYKRKYYHWVKYARL